MLIYIHGCNCGLNKHCIEKVKQSGEPVEIIDTRFDESLRQTHMNYLIENGIDNSMYTPIVVDGHKVTKLISWLTA